MEVKRYLEYKHLEEENVGSILTLKENLPEQLFKDIKKEMYGKALNNISILKKNFSQSFLNLLALKVKEKSFVPNEIVFKVKF